ncbi:hypothetical protein [Halogeometricum limi]|uniref:Uncharacterized protein n=1 Tax=Halogeometricum limi TaxID=555875 RepID=A0A1I6FQ72_9EURY|nr:hypothetical protein [Halogeometricum limi]SFR32090.1 hypothetical protein SAMN04488124_0059 [Halogeometricum limi]
MPMRQLRTCDFCGDDAVGIYEVLPAELSPTETEQRRVVLCADCSETLEGVLDPLLARLGVEQESTVGANEAERDASPEPVPAASGREERADDVAERRDDAANRRVDAPSTYETEAGDVTPMTERPADGPGEDERDDGAGEDDAGDDESGGDDSRGTETGDGEVTEEAVAEPAADYEADDADRKQTAADPSEDYDVVGDAGAPEAADDDSANEESVGAEPPQFRKVMRLLNNREFPVDRAEITDLASGAYGLERSEAAEILDYAIQRDVLREDDGQLRKA